MTLAELQHEHARSLGEPTTIKHKQRLIRRILWGEQVKAEGGLSARARRRADDLAKDADLRLLAPRAWTEAHDFAPKTPSIDLLPGQVLEREYKGRNIVVQVLPSGVEWEGRVYRSLTAAVQAITGQHWNGRHFFGLTKPRRTRR
jgi:hypothetical protein